MTALKDAVLANPAKSNTIFIDIRKTMQLVELIVAARSGNEIVLMDGDTPLARVSLTEEGKKPRRFLGLFPGAIWVSDDFDDPLPDEFWLGDDEPAT